MPGNIDQFSTGPVTWQIIIAAVGLISVGALMAWWFKSQMSVLKDTLLRAISQSRTDGDRQVQQVRERVDSLAQKVTEHELMVARDFAPRREIEDKLDKIDASISRLDDKVSEALKPPSRRNATG